VVSLAPSWPKTVSEVCWADWRTAVLSREGDVTGMLKDLLYFSSLVAKDSRRGCQKNTNSISLVSVVSVVCDKQRTPKCSKHSKEIAHKEGPEHRQIDDGQMAGRTAHITETNRIPLVLFDMHNGTLDPYLAATRRTLVLVMTRAHWSTGRQAGGWMVGWLDKQHMHRRAGRPTDLLVKARLTVVARPLEVGQMFEGKVTSTEHQVATVKGKIFEGKIQAELVSNKYKGTAIISTGGTIGAFDKNLHLSWPDGDHDRAAPAAGG
jgi:hypothetical protein